LRLGGEAAARLPRPPLSSRVQWRAKRRPRRLWGDLLAEGL